MWGQARKPRVEELITELKKFGEGIEKAVGSLRLGVKLEKPDPSVVRRVVLDPEDSSVAPIFRGLEGDHAAAEHFTTVLEQWCIAVETALMAETDPAQHSDAGPLSELEYWRGRMSTFNGLTEQLKNQECRTVLAACRATRSRCEKKWRILDSQITDAANEAKDNVKYLGTLEKYVEPLYSGTTQQIIDGLPAMMNNVKMMHTIARYYNTTERMTTLFCKITNQMITNCKMQITNHGKKKLWEQDTEDLLKRLEGALLLNETYQEQYRVTKAKLEAQPKGKQFDFSENLLFGKFELFCKRIQKLIDMFGTVRQFSALAKHKIDGMDSLINTFFSIIKQFREKPYGAHSLGHRMSM
jgi:dynein heavy chain